MRQLMWRILNAENQVLKYIQIFAAEKNQADLRNPCFCQKSGGFEKSLLLRKIRRIYRILVLYKKSAAAATAATLAAAAPAADTPAAATPAAAAPAAAAPTAAASAAAAPAAALPLQQLYLH